MEKEIISAAATQMKSKRDLLNLLNRIKQDDMIESGIAGEFHPFKMRHINYYCNPNNAFHRYRQFEIKKKSGGVRQITAPRNASFRYILYCLNIILKSIYTPSKYAMGFTEGRSVVLNADKHKGQNYVFNTDLKDFFPSIHQARVWKRLQLAPFNFAPEIASVIAGMCSMKEVIKGENEEETTKYILPQGAPTSPIITNMICDKLDHRLAGLAKRFGLNYTRYADDITFSSMHNVYQNEGAFRKELTRIITTQGFSVNETKTRLQKKGGRQEVTGIIVSDKLNVTQKYVRDIRNILYIWDRYGYHVAYSKFFPKYKAEKGHIKKGNPDLISVINGKLLYLKMVKGDSDSVFLRLYEKFIFLRDKSINNNDWTEIFVSSYDDGSTSTREEKTQINISYLDTTPVLDFEQINNTVINIEITKEKRKATYINDDKNVFLFVHKGVEATDNKADLAISVCKDTKGKVFQLIHKKGKFNQGEVLNYKQTAERKTLLYETIGRLFGLEVEDIEIGELNNDLDSLLQDI